jgi:hypothetical protein
LARAPSLLTSFPRARALSAEHDACQAALSRINETEAKLQAAKAEAGAASSAARAAEEAHAAATDALRAQLTADADAAAAALRAELAAHKAGAEAAAAEAAEAATAAAQALSRCEAERDDALARLQTVSDAYKIAKAASDKLPGMETAQAEMQQQVVSAAHTRAAMRIAVFLSVPHHVCVCAG